MYILYKFTFISLVDNFFLKKKKSYYQVKKIQNCDKKNKAKRVS